MTPRRALPSLASLAVVAFACPALAGTDPTGRYRVSAGPDLASELVIEADGHFEYALAYGALDERASGHWEREGNNLRLYTDPRPVPAAFSAAPSSRTAEAKLSLLVAWPNGRGIAGIDFRIGFAQGEPVTGYTQDDGWTLSPDETRLPLWIELVEPIHGVVSPHYPVDLANGNALRFTLTPNDLDVVDFQGEIIEIGSDQILLHRGGASLKYVRVDGR